MKPVCKTILLMAMIVCLSSYSIPNHIPRPAYGGINLSQRFECFNPLSKAAVYTVRLCADVPDNDHPNRVYVNQETGHVFLIFEKREPAADTAVAQVFGFYPRRPASCIVFKNVRCEILDNSKRDYDAEVSKEVNAEDFQLLLQKAEQLAQKKYNLNRFNCYDYALAIFNSLPGIEPLPVTRVKFPLIFGRGGSPCGLYKDLKKLKASASVWAPYIEFGALKAPASFKKM